MRQILLNAPGELVERQVPAPKPAGENALVRIRRVGVCGSDFHALAGRHPAYTYPRVLGHELAGEVVEVGTNHAGYKSWRSLRHRSIRELRRLYSMQAWPNQLL